MSEALWALGGAALTASFSWLLLILSLTAVLCFSSSLTDNPCLFMVLIVSSAYSFASLSISAASWLAFLIILSVLSSSLCCFALSSALRSVISFLYLAISSCSFLIVALLVSRSLMISSKWISSASIRLAASSIRYSGSPRRLDMAKALLLPGTPISRR